MKLLDRTFRYFYSTEVMTSVCQLREDFGDFPPKPLGGNGLPGHFTTVRVRGIGEHIHFAVMMKRLVGLPVRFARKPATSTKSYTGRVVLVGIASGFRSVG